MNLKWSETTFRLKGESMITVVNPNVIIKSENQSLVINHPWGAFVYNRPVAITTEVDGQQTRQLIVDVTRLAQLFFLALAIAIPFLARISSSRRESGE